MATERRIGRWHDPNTNTEWRVEKWTTARGDERTITENRLTRNALDQSERTTFAIVNEAGKVRYRTFIGPLPDDIQDLMNYWRQIKSI